MDWRICTNCLYLELTQLELKKAEYERVLGITQKISEEFRPLLIEDLEARKKAQEKKLEEEKTEKKKAKRNKYKDELKTPTQVVN